MSALAKFFRREEDKEDSYPPLVVIPPPRSIPAKEVVITKGGLKTAYAYILMVWEGLLVVWEIVGVATFFFLLKKDLPVIKNNSLVQMALFAGAVTALAASWGAFGYSLYTKIFLSIQFIRVLIFLGSPVDKDYESRTRPS